MRATAFIALAILAIAGCRASDGDQGPEGRVRAAADRFLDRYVAPNGRVVRHDEGGDTVSEGQAYAMLVAAAVGDRDRFDRVWRWTQMHLQRDDGLLSFLWRKGRVADPQPASDADLDAARALLLAADRFDDDRYHAEALRIARAILAEQTFMVDGRLTLAPGPWAVAEQPHVVNPSYFDPHTFERLDEATGDPRWRELRASSYRILNALMAAPPALPPNWAVLGASGTPRPRAQLDDPGAGVIYGFDAVRVLIRNAQDCPGPTPDPAARSVPFGRRLAARPWSFFRPQQDEVGTLYRLDGRALVWRSHLTGREVPSRLHPAGHVAAAAAAHAAEDQDARDRLLDQAEAIDRETPTYYGAALVALGRIGLTTDLLGACASDH